MPTKTKASAPAGSAEVKASATKPKAARRRGAAKRKAAPAKTAVGGRTTAQEVALRSTVAMAKLQSAVDQLEAALKDQPVVDAVVPAPPVELPPAAVSHPPTVRRPEIEVSPEVWSSAARPALATVAFLVFVAALMVGYSTGYAVGTDSVDDPMILVASVSERPGVSSTEDVLPAAPELESSSPAPMSEPAPVIAAAQAEKAGGLHLQVSALKSPEAAAALGARLENEGYPVTVREPEADGLVRVLVGPVSDGDQLSAMANRLREEGLQPFPKRL